MSEYYREYQDTMAEESMSSGAYMAEAMRQYAADRGQHRPKDAWILTDFDTWEPNPYYRGKKVPHPEDY